METLSAEQQKNWQVALQISRETRADPDSPYHGKRIAVADEKIVASADDLDQLYQQLDLLDGDTSDCVIIEADLDYERTTMIWSPQDSTRP